MLHILKEISVLFTEQTKPKEKWTADFPFSEKVLN